MKLEVGMYCRDDKGIICKIENIMAKELNPKYEELYLLNNGVYYTKKEIGEKASFNLIDLIEENDYVNGHLVHEIEEHSDGYDKELHLESCEVGSYRIDRYDAKDKIKSILTHELYEANCYKVVE